MPSQATMVKVAISLVMFGLIAWIVTSNKHIENDTVVVALLLIAVVPWLSSIIDTLELPGGAKVEFRRVKEQVKEQEKRLDAQQAVINQLVVFSMSFFIFTHLKHIYHKTRDGGEYLFRQNDAMSSDLRFLRDHGYMEHFNVGDLKDGQNLVGHLRLTPVGNFLVCVREQLEKQQSSNVAEQLSK